MAIDKEFYQDRIKEIGSSTTARTNQNLELLKKESVRAGALVGSAEWDTFLSYIESIIKSHRQVKEQMQAYLESSKMVDHNELMRTKIILREAAAVERALEHIVHLPYSIIHERSAIEPLLSKIPLPEIPEFFNNVN